MNRAESQPSGRWAAIVGRHLGAWALILAGLLVYANSFSGAFLWDDNNLVVDNVLLREPLGFLRFFSADIAAGSGEQFHFYRPLQMASYRVDYLLWGLRSAGYHAVNAGLHILAGWCLAMFLSRLWKDRLTAFLAALLFVVHPIHTEAVAYISGRADSLAAVFVFLALTAYVRSLDERRPGMYAGALAAYAAALLSRENTLVLPALLPLCHGALRRPVGWRRVLPFAALALGYVVLRLTLLHFLTLPANFPHFLRRFPSFLVALTRYLQLLPAPYPLHMEYGVRFFGLREPRVWIGLALLAALVGSAWALRRRAPRVAFGVAWFLVLLLPVTQIYPLNAYMAEHWLYLPSAGFFFIVAVALARLGRAPRGRCAALALAVALAAGWGALTVRQNAVWREPVAFFKRTLRFAPESSLVYNRLGLAYLQAGRDDEARRAFQMALSFQPGFLPALHNLALLLLRRDEVEQAVDLYEAARARQPGFEPNIWLNLAAGYLLLDRVTDALPLYERAVREMPGYAPAAVGLGKALERAGRLPEAAEAYRRAVTGDPRAVDAALALGRLYVRLDRLEDARMVYQALLWRWPELQEVYHELGRIWLQEKQYDQALAVFQAGLARFPDAVALYNNLAVTYLAAGRPDKALEPCRQALALQPDHEKARYNLEWALRLLAASNAAVSGSAKP